MYAVLISLFFILSYLKKVLTYSLTFALPVQAKGIAYV